MSIKQAIGNIINSSDLPLAARELFIALGYGSGRLINLPMEPRQLVNGPSNKPAVLTKSSRRFLQATKGITFLFQIQGGDIFRQVSSSPAHSNLGFKANDQEGILLASAELKRDDRLRFDYFQLAYVIGRRLNQSVFVVFSDTESVALAHCHKRPHKSRPGLTAIEQTGSTAGFTDSHYDWVEFIEDMSLSNVLDEMERVGAMGVSGFSSTLASTFPEGNGYKEWAREQLRGKLNYKQHGVCDGGHNTEQEALECGCLDPDSPLPSWGPPYGAL